MTEFLANIEDLVPGLWTSIRLTLASLAIGLPLGILFGQVLARGPRLLRWPVWLVVDVFRGFPTLVTLYLFYFGLPRLDLLLSDFSSVVAATAVTCAAYTAEMFKAAILSIPRGQREALAALGVPPVVGFRRVLLPQVWRMIAPPLVGIAILTFQASALAYSVGMRELLGIAYNQGVLTFQLFDVLLAAGFLYLAVSSALTVVEWQMRSRGSRRLPVRAVAAVP